jgi:hypothetical protein
VVDLIVPCDKDDSSSTCTRRFHACHTHFDTAVAVVVMANMVVMSMYYNSMGVAYGSVLDWVNTVFLLLFVVEMCAKVFALGMRRYWGSPSNAFDGAIVLGSVVLLVMSYLIPRLSAAKQARCWSCLC